MTRRPRGLRPEERDLWSRVAATARALHAQPARKTDATDRPAPKKARPAAPGLAIPEFRLGEMTRPETSRVDLAPSLAEDLSAHPLRMDRKAHARMLRGKSNPEARIDLHGMTVSQAQPELVRFILQAHAAGHRLVLVITGKGKRSEDHGPIPPRMGVLRHQVPHWLHRPPLAALVLQVATAHLKHGGEGAYYVYLRRAGYARP